MKRRSSPLAGGAPRAGGAPNAGVSPTACAPVFHPPAVRSGAPRAAPVPDASIDPGAGSPLGARATVAGSSTFHLPVAGDYPLRPIASPGSSNWYVLPSPNYLLV